jgi:hypothetical protein
MNDPASWARVVQARTQPSEPAAPRVWRLHNPRAAVLKLEWRIASASPEEQAMLDAHGFGRRCSEGSTWRGVYATEIYECSVGY